MTRATHWNRRWPGVKAAACGANAAPHGSNIRTDADAVTCRRCRNIIDWQAPIKPVERCLSVGPAPERFHCGLEAGHDGSHSALMETSAPWFPVERRATVAEGETRLALLERLLGDVVKAWDKALLLSPENQRGQLWRTARINAAIEAARAATGGKNG